MGRLSPSDTPAPSGIAANGALIFDYIEGGPGRQSARNAHHHSLMLAADDTSFRAIISRDDKTRQVNFAETNIALAPEGRETVWEWLDTAKVILIRLEPQALLQFVEHEMRLVPNGDWFGTEMVVADPELSEAARRLYEASLQQDIGAHILFDALARVFLVTLVRRYVKFDDFDPSGFGQAEYVAILDFIEARIDSKITPASLAELVGMSTASFGRKFKQRTGQSPMAFVKAARLRAALVHLHRGKLSLGEIAIRTGFADQAHFSRLFRATYGKSPRAYRADLR